MYFPTMPHDELFETADITTREVGRIYSKWKITAIVMHSDYFFRM